MSRVLPIIDRYLIREIALTLLATVLVLLAMVLSHRLAGYLSKAASGLLARDAIFLLIGLQATYFLVILMPLAFLLSVMLTLGRLYRDHEMTALAACGYGPLALYRAVLLLAAPVALFTAGLSMVLVPLMMDYQFEVLARARKEAEISMFVPGTFREALGGRHVVYIGALNQRELRDVFIQTRESNGDLSITTGQQGRQIVGDDGIRHIVLERGYRYRGVPGHGDYEMLHFDRATVRVDAAPPQQEWKHRETLPTTQLWGSKDPNFIAEWHMRLNSPIQILIITLWAPLIARTRPREGRYGRIVAAVLIYAVNFNLIGVGESWLSKGALSSTIGLWWVHGVFILFGVGLLLRYHARSRGIRLFAAPPKRSSVV